MLTSANSQDVKMKEAEEVLTILKSWSDGHRVFCNNTVFGLCEHATCTSVDEKTSICGCVRQENTIGEFALNIASSILMNSAIFRKAVIEVILFEFALPQFGGTLAFHFFKTIYLG